MRKKVCKIVIFLFVFVVVFELLQGVLHYRWSGSEDLYTRNMLYQHQPEDSIDVLFFGTSELYAGVFPTAMYHQTGMTSFNFAISNKSAITTYYQLEYALKYQTPDIVVCDFVALFSDSLPDGNEAIYRKVVDTMPDYEIKCKLIRDLCKEDETQSELSYYFPLLRYHSMWNDLTEKNFEKDYVYDTAYRQYRMGCLLSAANYNANDYKQKYVIEPALWQAESDPDCKMSSVSIAYYDKMIALCNSRGIKVVALIPPKLTTATSKVSQWDVMKDYFASRNVDVIDYNTYEAVCGLNLALEEDYYNAAHLNDKGALKLSQDLAVKLSQTYHLADHRESGDDEKYAVWEQYWEEFVRDYQE